MNKNTTNMERETPGETNKQTDRHRDRQTGEYKDTDRLPTYRCVGQVRRVSYAHEKKYTGDLLKPRPF